jgi:toxin FitB
LANVIEVTKETIDTCISLRRIRNIKLPDAIIAATALVYNLSIVSHNSSDFQNIEGLNVIDPYNL